jgi:hypothetical protein
MTKLDEGVGVPPTTEEEHGQETIGPQPEGSVSILSSRSESISTKKQMRFFVAEFFNSLVGAGTAFTWQIPWK